MQPDHEFEQRLADYLGDEMAPDARAEFDRELAETPDGGAEARALGRVIGTMASLDGVESWSKDDTTRDRGAVTEIPWRALVRYAAIIMVAFALGFVMRGASGPDDATTAALATDPSPATGPTAAPDDEWKDRVADAYVRNAGRSSMARTLIALAQTSSE